MAFVEHQLEDNVGALFDAHFADIANFHMVGNGTNGAFFRFQHFNAHADIIGQQGTAPASGAKRADGGKSKERRVDRQDGAVSRQIIGGAASGCCNQHAIADQHFEAHLFVDGQTQLGRLIALTQQGDFIDGQRRAFIAVAIERRAFAAGE